MAKFYFTSLGARPMRISGRVITFTVCSISGGRAAGVYEATDDEEIAVLDDAVRGRRGVKEIGEEEFTELKKKATATRPLKSSNVSSPRVVRIPTLPEMAVEARAGVPSAGLRSDGSQRALEDLPPSPSIASLLRTARVNPPKPFAASDEKTRKSSDRADRAKVRVSRKSVDTK